MPCTYDGSSLNGPDELEGSPAVSRVGSPCPDAPLREGYLLGRLGNEFVILGINVDVPTTITEDGVTTRNVAITMDDDPTGALAERYLGEAKSAVYLIRPDQHVAARWNAFVESALRSALLTACAKE